MRLLLVEDQPDLATLTSEALRGHGHVVDVATCLEDADAYFEAGEYDLLLLDRQLPDGDSLGWLRRVRRGGSGLPALVMTAERQQVDDRIEGLDAGADDYLLKPVDHAELAARVKALLRRPRELATNEITIGGLTLDLDGRAARVGERALRISPREFALLSGLARRAEKVVAKDSIEQMLYGFDEDITQNAIEVAVYRLRGRLQKAEAGVAIHTVRGVGYMLSARTS